MFNGNFPNKLSCSQLICFTWEHTRKSRVLLLPHCWEKDISYTVPDIEWQWDYRVHLLWLTWFIWHVIRALDYFINNYFNSCSYLGLSYCFCRHPVWFWRSFQQCCNYYTKLYVTPGCSVQVTKLCQNGVNEMAEVLKQQKVHFYLYPSF